MNTCLEYNLEQKTYYVRSILAAPLKRMTSFF